jgi:thiamine kinase-like enzyme
MYPSNVMISATPRLVDWEMAAVGPPLLDVAALTSGWDHETRVRLVDAYVQAAGALPWITPDFDEMMDCCRLHLAMQWLGWSPGWSPPAEHARDWLAEAFETGARLGL